MSKAIIYDGHELIDATYDKDSYEFLSSTVGGYIESVPISMFNDKNIDVWCNEEGKFIDGLEPTIALVHKDKIYDVVLGKIVFTRADDDGNTISLTDKDIDFIKCAINDASSWCYMPSIRHTIPAFRY